MRIMLRSDNTPDVIIHIDKNDALAGNWEGCTVEQLEQHIRTLQTARKWLLAEQAKKAREAK